MALFADIVENFNPIQSGVTPPVDSVDEGFMAKLFVLPKEAIDQVENSHLANIEVDINAA